ncbi:MAG: TRAPPC13 family protein, partial [Firmicutes bacterium]|nr:TRAPPC13 family protein [Bacillota bacterium]
PGISLKKYVSVDGGSTWHDAETAPGPTTEVGDSVRFKFVVSNTGNVTLTGIKLIDDTLDLSDLTYPDSLSSGSSFERILTGVEVKEEGQHVNIATVTGQYESQTYSDTDKAYYTGVKTEVSAPVITVKKYVSVDKGSNWLDANTAPGPSAWVDDEVWFKFVVTNTGNVTLTNLSLSDNEYSLSGASIPASLDIGKSFEYVLTGIKAKLGQQSNIATAIGEYGNQTVIDTDIAHYKGFRKDIPTPSTDGYGNIPLPFIIGSLTLTGGLLLRKKWVQS